MCKISTIDTQALISILRDRTFGPAKLISRQRRSGFRLGVDTTTYIGIALPAPQELIYPVVPGLPWRYTFQRFDRHGRAVYLGEA